MTKIEKLELEILAIKLWFQTFYDTKLCTDSESNYMSKKLNKLKDELSATKIKNF
jgi:hypothetical protein